MEADRNQVGCTVHRNEEPRIGAEYWFVMYSSFFHGWEKVRRKLTHFSSGLWTAYGAGCCTVSTADVLGGSCPGRQIFIASDEGVADALLAQLQGRDYDRERADAKRLERLQDEAVHTGSMETVRAAEKLLQDLTRSF